MKKIKHILCPTDFSETANNAFRYALWLADQYGASINLLHVTYPETEPMDFPVMSTQTVMNKMDVAREVMKTNVDICITQVQAVYAFDHVPDIHSDIEVGLPARVIASVANKSRENDLIVMGTHGEHNAYQKAFGSVTTATIRKAHCPVLVIPEVAEIRRLKTIAYATDLLETDPYNIWTTIRLFDTFNPVLRIVHIENEDDQNASFDMDELQTYFKESLPALRISYHNIVSKHVEGKLEEFADMYDVDMMVMYRPHRSLFERIFHSSLTRQAALRMKIPLLVIR